MTHKLVYTTAADGHVEVEYDTEVHSEVLAAEEKFNELLARQGTHAYVVSEQGGRKIADRTITSFDPNAQEILVTSPLVGG